MKALVKTTSKSKRAGYTVMYIAPYLTKDHDYSKALCKDIFKNYFVLPMKDLIFTNIRKSVGV